MDINPIEPSQRQKDSEDDMVAAIAKQVAVVGEQVAMVVGPSRHIKTTEF